MTDLEPAVQSCYCGGKLALAECCMPFIEGVRQPDNAEQLMRSRFTAFCLARGDYLYQTYHPDFRNHVSVQELTDAARSTFWLKLEVFSHNVLSLDTSQVAFRAWYRESDRLISHSELSFFRRVDGRWLYTYGEIDLSNRKVVRIGRNDLCPCGSGLKFKKCCFLL